MSYLFGSNIHSGRHANLGGQLTPDSATKVLMNFTGTDQSTTFTDTALGGVGNPHSFSVANSAQIDTDITDPFGGNSGVMQVSRASNDYIYTASGSNDFELTDQDFVVEAFVYVTNTGPINDYFFAATSNDSAGAGWRMGILYNGSQVLGFERSSSAGGFFVDTVDFTFDQWVHVACSRDGSTFNLYKAGTRVAQDTNANAIAAGNELYIGNSYTNPGFAWNGYISNLRVTIGSNRGYTGASITVPTDHFTPYV